MHREARREKRRKRAETRAADRDRGLRLLPAPIDDDGQLLRLRREEIERPKRRARHERLAAIGAGQTPAAVPRRLELDHAHAVFEQHLHVRRRAAIVIELDADAVAEDEGRRVDDPARLVHARPRGAAGASTHARRRRAKANPVVLPESRGDAARDFDGRQRLGRLVDAPGLGAIPAIGGFELVLRGRREVHGRHRTPEADVEEAQALQGEPARCRAAARFEPIKLRGRFEAGLEQAIFPGRRRVLMGVPMHFERFELAREAQRRLCVDGHRGEKRGRIALGLHRRRPEPRERQPELQHAPQHRPVDREVGDAPPQRTAQPHGLSFAHCRDRIRACIIYEPDRAGEMPAGEMPGRRKDLRTHNRTW